ncbi:MAG: hypothetical protein RIB60_03470 [Phycisphaerales bacterium]
MKTYLDNEPIDVPEQTVAAAINAAREAAESRSRIVVEVQGDGAPLPAGVIDDPPADDAGLTELRFLSAVPGPFVRETLLEASGALEAAAADRQAAADRIQGGSIAEAIEPLQRVLETWSVVGDVVERSGSMMGVDVAKVDVPASGDRAATTGEACIQELAGRLAELKGALAGQDWAGVSDLLAYEMDGLTDRWRGLLDQLASEAMEAG